MPELLNQRLPIPDELAGAKSDVTALQREQVIRLKIEGWSSRDIAKEVNLGESTVRRLVRAAVDEAKATERVLITERYHIQDLRIEWLIEKVMGHIRSAPEFDERLLRQVISLFDRQAKLHGLDKVKQSGSMDWLSGASPDELVKAARERGIKLPEKFITAS